MWFSVTYLVKFAICNKLIFFSLFTKLFRFIKPYQSIHIIYLNSAESFSTALNMCCLEIQIPLTWNYRLVPLTWNGQLKNGKTLLVSKVTIRFVFPCQTSITGPFLQKQGTAASRELFLQKWCITDVWQLIKHTS